MRAATRTLFIFLAAVTLDVPAMAQQPALRSITRYQVKPDRMGDFVGGIKERRELLIKAGSSRSGTWWRSVTGPTEFVFVRPLSSMAELDRQDPKLKDVQGELARLHGRMLQCVESIEMTVDALQPEMSMEAGGDMPAMVRAVVTSVRHNDVAEYSGLFTRELLPLLRAAGVKSFLTYRIRFGGPVNEFRSSMPLTSLADIDKDPAPSEEVRQYWAKVAPMVLERRVNVYRLMPNLSILPSRSTAQASAALLVAP